MGMKFDGKILKDGSKSLANVRGDKIYDGSGSSKCLANHRSGSIYEGSGSSRKQNTFVGHRGSVTQWTLWFLFCK